MYPLSLQTLIEQFRRLPGVGEKTAERYALVIADLPEEDARSFAEALINVKTRLHRCPVCGKTVRPDVTLYGEFLPQPAYTNAINLIGRADCLIVGGTSLEVGSAAQLVHMFHGSHLVIINKGRTKMEGAADLVFHDSIGKVLERI